MTDKDKLLRDIDTLRESIRLDWVDLARLSLTQEERGGIRQHIELCFRELQEC
jgi:hypothetical protein